MKLKQRKVPYLSRAKDVSLSAHHLVAYTGKRVYIADRELNLLRELDGFDYAYCGHISPDETRLLVLSNANKFYLVSLSDYSVERVTVKGEYNGNLEGCGCWSHDGRELLIPVQNQWGLSALRIYAADAPTVYRDYLPAAYWLTRIVPVKSKGEYLLTAFDRRDHTHYLLWFDGEGIEAYPLEGFDDVVLSLEYDEERDTVELGNPYRLYRYDGHGHRLPDVEALDALPKTVTLGGHTVTVPVGVSDYCVSADGRYGFAASPSGLYVIDLSSGEIAAHAPEPYGVQAVRELSPGLVAASTWNGVKIYELC